MKKTSTKPAIPHIARQLPGGYHHDNVAKVHAVVLPSGRIGRIFFKMKSGEVYADREVDLAAAHRSNNTERRVFANLAGTTVKELNALSRQRTRQDNEEYRKRRLRQNIQELQRAGYRVTKPRPKKVEP